MLTAGVLQDYKTSEKQNSAYYSRWFRTSAPDAMGNPTQHRGFSDPNVFMAMTSQEHVPEMTVCGISFSILPHSDFMCYIYCPIVVHDCSTGKFHHQNCNHDAFMSAIMHDDNKGYGTSNH